MLIRSNKGTVLKGRGWKPIDTEHLLLLDIYLLHHSKRPGESSDTGAGTEGDDNGRRRGPYTDCTYVSLCEGVSDHNELSRSPVTNPTTGHWAINLIGDLQYPLRCSAVHYWQLL